MATINDVAAHAGVGAGTVSRVLNDSPKVSETTRARVLAAIELLDYRPNPMAQGLSRGRCQTIGVVVPFFTHASAVERLRGVIAALDGSRYDLVLFNVQSPAHRDEHFASLRRRDRADGLLVMSIPPPKPDLARLREAGVPVVLVDVPGNGAATVVIDDTAGGRMATEHLLSLGHERIGFIGDHPDNSFGFTSSAAREAGYREALTAAGIGPSDELVRYGPHESTVAVGLAADLFQLPDPPTAVFASSDVQATGVITAARAAALHVPDDVSVVGFDDVELARYTGLTTIHQPLFDSGLIGAELLLAAVEHDQEVEPVVHELPVELVVRSTTAERAA
jgi:DNA-binding LacI/PurR family transcriptional regulator